MSARNKGGRRRKIEIASHSALKLNVTLISSEEVQALRSEVKALRKELKIKDLRLMQALQYAPRYMEMHDLLLQAKHEMKLAGLDTGWIGEL